jgi:hypothetical protein
VLPLTLALVLALVDRFGFARPAMSWFSQRGRR